MRTILFSMHQESKEGGATVPASEQIQPHEGVPGGFICETTLHIYFNSSSLLSPNTMYTSVVDAIMLCLGHNESKV